MLQGGLQKEISDESRKDGQNLSTCQKFRSKDPHGCFEGLGKNPEILILLIFEVKIPLCWTGYA